MPFHGAKAGAWAKFVEVATKKAAGIVLVGKPTHGAFNLKAKTRRQLICRHYCSRAANVLSTTNIYSLVVNGRFEIGEDESGGPVQACNQGLAGSH